MFHNIEGGILEIAFKVKELRKNNLTHIRFHDTL
jgi:hypothetical protein